MSRPLNILGRVAALSILATAGLTAVASSALADTTTRIALTQIGIYPRSAPSMSAPHAGPALSDGTEVSLKCETEGEPVSNGHETIAIWDQLSDGTWLPNAFLKTGTASWTPGVPRCSNNASATDKTTSRPSAGGYDRSKAARYASRHFDDPERFPEEDCTWFVSNALWAGGMDKTDKWTTNSRNWGSLASKRDIVSGGPTKTTTNPEYLKEYLKDEGLATVKKLSWSDQTAGGAQVGDLIAYDWDRPGPDGRLDHVAIITKIDSTGYPLRTQHTPARSNAGWSWDPGNHDWIEFSHTYGERKPVAYLIHIK